MINLNIPCHWDRSVLGDVLNQSTNSKGIIITEMYGCLASGVIGHGRDPNTVFSIGIDEALEFREYVKECKIKFSYLLNTPFSTIRIKSDLVEIERYIEWIGKEFKPDAVVIASYELMKVFRNKFRDLPIHVSTIARVSRREDIDKYGDIFPKKIIVQHDVNRNFNDLEVIIERAAEIGIDVELMLTESCLRKCPYMQGHYDHVGRGRDDKMFHFTCNSEKLASPSEILKANFIRPEDMYIYESMGINSFKITGRSKKSLWLPEVIRAYLNRDFKGNLVRLLGIDSSISAEDWIFVENKALDGFLDGFPRTGNVIDENEYCESWAVKLFKEGNLRVNGFEYVVEDGKLVCKNGLSKLDLLYKG